MDQPPAAALSADSAQTSISKVKVEYTDPSGLFSQISKELHARLPLRNLNWNSQSRPLRSIESLFVELVPDELSAQPTGTLSVQDGTPNASRTSLNRQSEPANPPKERRHQIPGLRSTPYLRVYFLRCDDPETYKTSSRKILREWIKSHHSDTKKTPSSNNQEKHDAFEWLIVHVAPVERGSPWPSKSQTNVLDKIRSDFNSSSKNAVDRVTQIPLANNVHDQRLPVEVSPAGANHDTFSRQFNFAWDDLLAKFKALILNSFDSRVRQYEDDIKEKGSQRSIPGWNFCTFFMLKEGLARGFESVGLIEDALMGYDELSVELLSAIRDQHNKAAAGESTTLFRDHTEDLVKQAKLALHHEQQLPSEDDLENSTIFSVDAERKPYRDLILANNISTFDFRCYLFARQVSVLLRIASISGTAAKGETSVDPAVLAEICRRANSFISSNSRAVRQDLRTSLGFDVEEEEEETDKESSHKRYVVIENLVASWIYNAAQQILAQTEEPSLSGELDQISRKTPRINIERPSNKKISHDAPRPSINDPPARSSSIRPQSISLMGGQQEPANEDRSPAPQPQSIQRKVALIRLAGQRAELFLLARRALSTIGERIGWKSGWRNIKIGDSVEEMDDVDLDSKSEPQPPQDSKAMKSEPYFLSSILNDVLRDALKSEEAFNSTYEDLSWEAYNLFQYADDDRSVHAMFADIATLRFQLSDYPTAASYFHQLAPFYAEHDWSELELAILDMYARSLKELSKAEEYVRIALKLLAKVALQARRDIKLLGSTSGVAFASGTSKIGAAKGHLFAIVEASKTLNDPCMTHLRNFFQDLRVDPHIHHIQGRDGFGLTVALRHILPDVFKADTVSVRLISATESQNKEIWLGSTEPVIINPGKVRISVESNVMIPDRYLVDKVIIKAGNIVFQHDYAPFDSNNDRSSARDSVSSIGNAVNKEPILVWAPTWGFKVSALAFPEIHLDEPRSILFKLWSGNEDVINARLHLRAGSAGLRLHTADAKVLQGESEIKDQTQPGIISFQSIPAKSTVQLTVPYQLEQELKDIMFRSEVTYTTSEGECTSGSSHSFSVLLPLGVNVQDIFKAKALYSKFSISTSSMVPLRVLDCRMVGTKDYEAETPTQDSEGLCVFPKQPVYMVYRTARKTRKATNDELETRMLMHVRYQCLDEEIIGTIQDCLVENLADTDLKGLRTLLLPHLHSVLRDKLSGQDLALIGLLREIGLAEYAEFQWDRILFALPDNKQHSLKQWLQNWHRSHPTIPLPNLQITTPTRQITIPVDVPPMEIVQTASLRLLQGDTKRSTLTRPLTVGEAVPAELSIKHTRAWSHSSSSKSSRRPLSFAYELDAAPDTWLVGGRRRACFSASENKVDRFAVLLLPQRPGHLMLPTLDIRPVMERPGGEGGRGGAGGASTRPGREDSPGHFGNGDDGPPEPSCEVDYLNQGEAVLVVPSLKSTTVAMDFEGSGGSWLVEAEAQVELEKETAGLRRNELGIREDGVMAN